MLTEVKEVLVKAHNSISKVKQYYVLLYCLYKILLNKLKHKRLDKELILQIAIKAVNNTTKLERLVLTLLVFKTYLRISSLTALFLLVLV
jgi:hypothetical protein